MLKHIATLFYIFDLKRSDFLSLYQPAADAGVAQW